MGDLDVQQGMHERIRANRQLCAALWGCLFVLAFMGVVLEAGQPASIAVIGSLIVSLLTLSLAKFEPEEALVYPRLYRIVAGAWLAVSLGGVVLKLIPDASKTNQFFAAYFGAVSVLAYRAVVARGPRRAVNGVVISVLLWFPLVLFLFTQNDAREHEPLPNWTENATFIVLQLFVLVLPVVAAAALVTFMPRQDQVPAARVVSDNR